MSAYKMATCYLAASSCFRSLAEGSCVRASASFLPSASFLTVDSLACGGRNCLNLPMSWSLVTYHIFWAVLNFAPFSFSYWVVFAKFSLDICGRLKYTGVVSLPVAVSYLDASPSCPVAAFFSLT